MIISAEGYLKDRNLMNSETKYKVIIFCLYFP